jgi:hypothetical protein
MRDTGFRRRVPDAGAPSDRDRLAGEEGDD